MTFSNEIPNNVTNLVISFPDWFLILILILMLLMIGVSIANLILRALEFLISKRKEKHDTTEY